MQQLTSALSDPTQGDAFFTVTVNSNFPNAATFIGDYSAIAATPTGVDALWTDLRLPSTFPGFSGSGEDAFFADPPTGDSATNSSGSITTVAGNRNGGSSGNDNFLPTSPPPVSGPVGSLSLFAFGLGPTGLDLFEVDSQGNVFVQNLFGGGLVLVDTSLHLPSARMTNDALLALLAGRDGQNYLIDVLDPWLPSIDAAVLDVLQL